MFRRLGILILAITPSAAFAVSKEIQELQRDVAQLQDMVRAMQRSQDEKFSAMQVLVQQALSAATDASKSAAVIQSNLRESLRDMENKVVAPVAGLNSRMDALANDTRTTAQAMADLTSAINKLQQQLGDLNNAVKVMQAPSAPPPGGSGSPTGIGAPSGAPPMSQRDLYEAADRDRTSGKFPMALEEYQDYLKYYGTTDMAPNAQFYIATIHDSQGDREAAVREYDAVIKNYPNNTYKVPDALYAKGVALMRLNRRMEAADSFRELISRFPRNDLATKACDGLKSMGLGCGPRAAAPTKGAAKKSKR